jgi:hypothetical protein
MQQLDAFSRKILALREMTRAAAEAYREECGAHNRLEHLTRNYEQAGDGEHNILSTQLHRAQEDWIATDEVRSTLKASLDELIPTVHIMARNAAAALPATEEGEVPAIVQRTKGLVILALSALCGAARERGNLDVMRRKNLGAIVQSRYAQAARIVDLEKDFNSPSWRRRSGGSWS